MLLRNSLKLRVVIFTMLFSNSLQLSQTSVKYPDSYLNDCYSRQERVGVKGRSDH